MFKRPLKVEKATCRNRKIMKEKNLIGIGKYAVKVVDKPLIQLVGRIKDKSSKIVYIHKWM